MDRRSDWRDIVSSAKRSRPPFKGKPRRFAKGKRRRQVEVFDQVSWLERIATASVRWGYGEDSVVDPTSDLATAFTHRTFAHEASQQKHASGQTIIDNQRLEFLGDSILGFIVAERLMALHPQASEGELSELRSRLINADTLSFVAEREELEPLLRLGKGEPGMGPVARRARLADLTEAVIGAVYLDLGYSAVSNLIWQWLQSSYEQHQDTETRLDPKTRLQHWAHQTHHITPRYITETDPHGFKSDVWLEQQHLGTGRGETKRKAQFAAAENALKLVNPSIN